MGKVKMDSAAAERIRSARGTSDGFAKRASDAARRNEQSQSSSQRGSTSSSGSSGSSSGSSGKSSSGKK